MRSKFKETIRRLLPARLKSHRILGGPLAGYYIYTSWHDYPGAIRGSTEAPLLQWFERNVKAGETWLDVGAHYGYTAIALSRLVGRGGRVIAFEPVLSTADCIERTREANQLDQLRILPMGLSSESKVAPCLLPVYRGMAGGSLGNSGPTESVVTAGFDGFWESLCTGDPVIHGVKIDVQGMEGAVLAGMKGSLRRWRPKLVIEFHAGVNRQVILSLLEDCGYDPHPAPLEVSSHLIENDKSYAFTPLK